MDLEIENKTIIITGGAQGIGKAIAESFLKEKANVVILDKNKEKLCKTVQDLKLESGRISGYSCDVTDEKQVKENVQKIYEKFSGINYLINNAGISAPAPIQDITLESWKEVIEVNLTGVFLVSKYVFSKMMEQNSGVIINISSFAGKRGTLFGDNTSYSASKAGILGFSKALALEGARYGIRVIGVCPGIVKTDLLKAISEEKRNKLASYVPLKRLAYPEEIAEVITFLCSDKSSYVTGEIMDINGGLYMD